MLDLHSQLFNIGRPVLIASHPRSGTHLTIDLLRRQFRSCSSWKNWGESHDHLYLTLEAITDQQKGISIEKALNILSRAKRPLIKTHADPQLSHLTLEYPEIQLWIKNHTDKIYVIRDGRSVLCSLHLFMQSFEPETRCPLSSFIRQKINQYSRVKIWANHVQAWLNEPNVILLKFENLIQDPDLVINLLSERLNLHSQYVYPLLPKSPRSIWEGRWNRLTKNRPESTAIIGYYKGQKTLNWKRDLTTEDLDFFKQEAGDLFNKLGYEL